MPLLDVTDVLYDPMFATSITVLRTTEGIDSNGRGYKGPEVSTTVVAVVIPQSGAVLQRLAEGSNISESITVYTEFRLSASVDGQSADEILWNGRRYVVKNVSDYSQYGRGFMSAVCDFKGMVPP